MSDPQNPPQAPYPGGQGGHPGVETAVGEHVVVEVVVAPVGPAADGQHAHEVHDHGDRLIGGLIHGVVLSVRDRGSRAAVKNTGPECMCLHRIE